MAIPAEETFNVVLTKHARKRVALRFGFVPYVNEGTVVGNFKEDATKAAGREGKDALIYDGKLILQDQKGKRKKTARIVISKDAKRVITVYRFGEGRADENVVKRIDELCKAKKININFLAQKLHKPYRNNKLTLRRLFAILRQEGVGVDGEESKRLLQQEDENDQLKKEIAQEQSVQAAKLEGHPIDIDVSPIHILQGVQIGKREKRGKMCKCTYLSFGYDAPERIMDEVFDQDGSITEKAKSLIGKPVFTLVWQPQIYDSMKWWRNIFEAK